MDLERAVVSILAARGSVPAARSVLVGISGIDGAGKGFVAARLAALLEGRGLRVAVLPLDGWLRLPSERFDESDPAGHFYRNAIRFEEMLSSLVLPLRDSRGIDVVVPHAEETATEYVDRRYVHSDVDVVVLEGIFLFKRELVRHFDARLWVDCPFDLALERALARGQEGLDPEATARAYRTIYFPAQRIHFDLDDPVAGALVVDNAASCRSETPLSR